MVNKFIIVASKVNTYCETFGRLRSELFHLLILCIVRCKYLLVPVIQALCPVYNYNVHSLFLTGQNVRNECRLTLRCDFHVVLSFVGPTHYEIVGKFLKTSKKSRQIPRPAKQHHVINAIRPNVVGVEHSTFDRFPTQMLLSTGCSSKTRP